MKYKVLKTCHAGGRMCREGAIVDFKEKIDNKYLELVVEKKGAKKEKEEPKKEGQSLGDLGKRQKMTTGMSAKRGEEGE